MHTQTRMRERAAFIDFRNAPGIWSAQYALFESSTILYSKTAKSARLYAVPPEVEKKTLTLDLRAYAPLPFPPPTKQNKHTQAKALDHTFHTFVPLRSRDRSAATPSHLPEATVFRLSSASLSWNSFRAASSRRVRACSTSLLARSSSSACESVVTLFCCC